MKELEAVISKWQGVKMIVILILKVVELSNLKEI